MNPTGAAEEPTATPEERIAALEQEAAALRSQRDAAWGQLAAMRASASWRLTWPLRRLARLRSR